MTSLKRAVLELDADVDPDTDGTDTGIFEMVGNLEVQEGTNVEHLLASGQGSTLNAIVTRSIDTVGDIIGDTESRPTARAGFYLDGGGGEHFFDINFKGWEGATDKDGEDLQWGNTGETGEPTAGDATGANALAQMHVLQRYINIGTFDSRSPDARLRFGEYNEDGLYEDYVQVTVQRMNVNRVADDPIQFDGSMRLVETQPWDSIFDAIERIEW